MVETIKEILIPEALEVLKTNNLESLINKDYTTFNILETRHVITNNLSWFLPTYSNFNILLKHLESSNSILDVGCGTAITGKYILKTYPNKPYLGIRAKSMYDMDEISYIDKKYIKEVNQNHIYLSPYNHDTILLIWPPYGRPLAYEVLKEFIRNPIRKKLIYIGELYFGCNGDERFQDLLGTLIEDNENNSNRYKVTIRNDWDKFPGINDIFVVIEK